jgi:regulator of sigma E protease
MSVLHSVLAFIVALGILVTIHEFGHFWVARRFGVKILRFSVGFGRALWSRRFGPDRTEFVIAAIPLGGYVKMLDEREGEVPADELPRAFNRQPLGSRVAIVAAGPGLNFLFAVLLYWLMFVIGVTGPRPIIGEVDAGSSAARGGLAPGHEIVAVDGEPTPTWESVLHAAMQRVLAGEELRLRLRDERGIDRDVVLSLRDVNVDDVSKGDFFDRLGMHPYRPAYPPVIGEIVKDGAAERAGLRAGDRIRSVDGIAIEEWGRWVEVVRAHPGQTISVLVERDGETALLEVRPEPDDSEGETIGRIGAALDQSTPPARAPSGIERYAPHAALGKALVKTWEVSTLTLRILGLMLVGDASVQNLSGPISIAQYAGQSASIGLVAFLSFLAIVSVSLGVLNLLPIPLLDGGHLLYYLIEFVTRRPVSEGIQAFGQQVGLVLLLGLMGLAFYNDLMRLL